MRVLADQDVYKITIEQLKKWGHDVVTVKELGIQKVGDEHSEEELRNLFCVVEPHRHRIRQLR